MTTAERRPPVPVTLDVAARDLDVIDKMAERAGVSRADVLRQGIAEMLQLICPDCGVDAWAFEEDGQLVHEEFYVSDELWDRTCPDDGCVRGSLPDGTPYGTGRFVMCLGCFEVRLGRRLVRDDFKGPPRYVGGLPPSPRFLDRYGRTA